MIEKISYMITTETNPYKNLALEEYLLKQVGDKEVILYLWQNERTVVIGRNQNPWKECRIAELTGDNGRLVRRLSGGGAVFHDLGNLNFTFLARTENYQVERQMDVILEAVRQQGIPAQKTGRNDISVEEKKFSGNAFYSDGAHCYHHGTILVEVDMGMLSHYLNVSRDKLVSKGVESVRSRVTNLRDYDPDLTIQVMREELLKAFQQVYGLEAAEFDTDRIDTDALLELEVKFSSEDWILGKKMEFNYSMSRRFVWGEVDLRMEVVKGIITNCIIYTDALETQLFELFADRLVGIAFSSAAMNSLLSEILVEEKNELIKKDIIEFISDENI